MKKVLLLLLCVPLFFSCSKDEGKKQFMYQLITASSLGGEEAKNFNTSGRIIIDEKSSIISVKSFDNKMDFDIIEKNNQNVIDNIKKIIPNEISISGDIYSIKPNGSEQSEQKVTCIFFLCSLEKPNDCAYLYVNTTVSMFRGELLE